MQRNHKGHLAVPPVHSRRFVGDLAVETEFELGHAPVAVDEDVVEAARRGKRVFQHGTQMRSSEVTAEAGKVLASGMLGEIRHRRAKLVAPAPTHSPTVRLAR